MPSAERESKQVTRDSPRKVLLVFLRLGLTCFGGPIAHLGFFRDEFVTRRRWLSERSYADLVALCQFLPGPASSQVGMAIGLSRAGFRGALAAWTGFTIPSAILLVLFARGLSVWGSAFPIGILHGLKVAAVAVVAQAVWGMGRTSCTDAARITIAAMSACVVLLWSSAWCQVGVIAAAGVLGIALFKPAQPLAHDPLPISVSRRAGAALLAIFFGLLIGLPIAAVAWPEQTLSLVNAFYRAGSLVFGGGHVVLPLLQSAVVPSGGVTNETFVAGYGAAQAVPGPLFTFAAFLGASMAQAPNGWFGASVCLVAIFLPSFLLVAGVLPFWEQLRHNRRAQAALAGVNAAVVGLLLAALYQPVWTTAVVNLADFALALTALAALMFWKLPSWLLVVGCGMGGWLLSMVG